MATIEFERNKKANVEKLTTNSGARIKFWNKTNKPGLTQVEIKVKWLNIGNLCR